MHSKSHIGLFFILLLVYTLSYSQDSILLERPKSVDVIISEIGPNDFKKPMICKSKSELEDYYGTDCFKFLEDIDFKANDLLIWAVYHTDYYCDIDIQIWKLNNQNSFTIEAVRKKTEKRNLNSLQSIMVYQIPKLPKKADLKYVITDK